MANFEAAMTHQHGIDIGIDNMVQGAAGARWAGPSDWTNLRTRVANVRDVAAGVRELTLQRLDGAPFPAWVPGSHIDLGVGGHIRQYSLCGPLTRLHEFRVAVGLALESRGGSRWVHEDLMRDAELEVSGLRNNFPLEPASGYQFIAGGIGITPLISMIAYVARAERPWRLVYGGRTRESMAYADAVVAMGPERVTVLPEDQDGLMDLETIVSRVPADYLIYACGPTAMLAALGDVCDRRGVTDRLRVEAFTPVPNPGANGTSEAEFEVACARDGRAVTVRPDQSILEALEESGMAPEYGCREGTCSSCEVAVLEGIPDHRDWVLTANEKAGNDCMMICTSRSYTPRLVIDL